MKITDNIGQNVTILVNILQYHTISDNISRYITILDEILSIYNNIKIELYIMEELSILKLEISIWKILDNIGQYQTILGNIGQYLAILYNIGQYFLVSFNTVNLGNLDHPG